MELYNKISYCKTDDIPHQMGRPRWLSWMRRPTGDQEVAGSTPAEVSNILSWRNRHGGSVVECPLCDREVAGSIPSRVIPKTLKMVLAALSLGAQH